jgi:sigma-B regulation protein RsbU (phosphoserine phosphatase)
MCVKIKWKIIILILSISVIPLISVTIINQISFFRLGKSLSDITEQSLTTIVSRELQQTAENYAKIFSRERDVLNLGLRVLTLETQKFLNSKRNVSTKIYYAKDYDNSVTVPSGMITSDIHRKLVSDKSYVPMKINKNHQVFFLPKGVTKDTVSIYTSGLSRLLPVHKKLHIDLNDVIYWQYVSLKNGVHVAYPGHGGYPESYKPRKREWYVNARKTMSLYWSNPYVDASTGQVIMTCAMPVVDANGAFAGVAGLDVLVSQILQGNNIAMQWSDTTESVLVQLLTNVEMSETVKIMAMKNYTIDNPTWETVLEGTLNISSDTNYLPFVYNMLRQGYLPSAYHPAVSHSETFCPGKEYYFESNQKSMDRDYTYISFFTYAGCISVI